MGVVMPLVGIGLNSLAGIEAGHGAPIRALATRVLAPAELGARAYAIALRVWLIMC
jgi:hypothetical protein